MSNPIKTIYPHRNYLYKLYAATLFWFLLVIFPWIFLGFLPALGWLYAVIFLGANALWMIPTFALYPGYYRSISYEIKEDEIVVRKGIITKSVKVVPYRTVTNLDMKRDPFDRWFFGIGSLHVQTAGLSGQTGAEQVLVGLEEYEDALQIIRNELRRFRGSMATTAEVEPAAQISILSDLLVEVRQIRESLPKN
jgi:membrane protein YdbS with pleckstrin-like domain